VRERADQIASELIDTVPPKAVRGREVQLSRERSQLVNAARAEIWFNRALREARLTIAVAANPQAVSVLRADEEVPV